MPHTEGSPNNHGVLEGRQPGGRVAGELPYVVRIPNGDWSNVMTTFDTQASSGGDRMNCVTESHQHSIERQMMFDIAHGLMPQPHQDFLRRNGYFDANGNIKFSKKFNAIRNGTTIVGNWLYIVGDDAELDSGLIPEGMFPSETNEIFDAFYDKRQVTQKMINLGREFLQWFALPWEWIGSDIPTLMFHLKQAPIQVVIPGHAILEILNKNTLMNYLDSYPPYIKEVLQNKITDALKVVVQYKTFNLGNTMIFFQVKGAPAIWQLTNEVWVGFADFAAFQRYTAGFTTKVLEIDQAEFDKIPKSTEVLKT